MTLPTVRFRTPSPSAFEASSSQNLASTTTRPTESTEGEATRFLPTRTLEQTESASPRSSTVLDAPPYKPRTAALTAIRMGLYCAGIAAYRAAGIPLDVKASRVFVMLGFAVGVVSLRPTSDVGKIAKWSTVAVLDGVGTGVLLGTLLSAPPSLLVTTAVIAAAIIGTGLSAGYAMRGYDMQRLRDFRNSTPGKSRRLRSVSPLSGQRLPATSAINWA